MAARRRGLEIKLDNASRSVRLPAGPRGPHTRSRPEAAFLGGGAGGANPWARKDGRRAGCWGRPRGELRFRCPPWGSGHAEVFTGGPHAGAHLKAGSVPGLPSHSPPDRHTWEVLAFSLRPSKAPVVTSLSNRGRGKRPEIETSLFVLFLHFVQADEAP